MHYQILKQITHQTFQDLKFEKMTISSLIGEKSPPYQSKKQGKKPSQIMVITAQ